MPPKSPTRQRPRPRQGQRTNDRLGQQHECNRRADDAGSRAGSHWPRRTHRARPCTGRSPPSGPRRRRRRSHLHEARSRQVNEAAVDIHEGRVAWHVHGVPGRCPSGIHQPGRLLNCCLAGGAPGNRVHGPTLIGRHTTQHAPSLLHSPIRPLLPAPRHTPCKTMAGTASCFKAERLRAAV
jgi:hypothetical protein